MLFIYENKLNAIRLFLLWKSKIFVSTLSETKYIWTYLIWYYFKCCLHDGLSSRKFVVCKGITNAKFSIDFCISLIGWGLTYYISICFILIISVVKFLNHYFIIWGSLPWSITRLWASQLNSVFLVVWFQLNG